MEPTARIEPSKRRLTWPNGAIATTYSADEPNRLRGPQHDAAYADEIATWPYPAALDNLLLGLRLGKSPRLCVTTTPRPVRLVKQLVGDPTTAISRGSTYENRSHLAASFFDQIVSKYEGTRLGQQEIHAELLEISEGAWFATFDPAKHVDESAEYDTRYPVHLAIDAGASLYTGAVFFQVRQLDAHRHRVTVFGEYVKQGLYSEANAKAILALAGELPCRGRVDKVRLDPAATARSGTGPVAYGEYERIFRPRVCDRWPTHRVRDGLDQLELLLEKGLLIIHPRCAMLRAAFQSYVRKQSAGGEWLDDPVDPQHPHEDLMDALRGGVRDRFPEGQSLPSQMRTVSAKRLM